MFREMRRFKQQLPQEECVEILGSMPRGILSVQGDDGYPYGVPMDFVYDAESGNLFFHAALAGHKADAVKPGSQGVLLRPRSGTAEGRALVLVL